MTTKRHLFQIAAAAVVVAAIAPWSAALAADDPKAALNLPTHEQFAQMAALDANLYAGTPPMGDEQRRVAIVDALAKYKGTPLEATLQLRLAMAQYSLAEADAAKKSLEALLADAKSVAIPDPAPENPDAPPLTKDEQAMLDAVTAHLEKNPEPACDYALVLLASIAQAEEDYAGMWKDCEKAEARYGYNPFAPADRDFLAGLLKKYPQFTPGASQTGAVKSASAQVMAKLRHNRLFEALINQAMAVKSPKFREKTGVTDMGIALSIVRLFQDFDYLLSDEEVAQLSATAEEAFAQAEPTDENAAKVIETAKKMIEKVKAGRK